MSKLIDLTHLIDDKVLGYPNVVEEPKLYKTKDIVKDGYTYHKLDIGMHIGTHIDVPMHLIQKRYKCISEFPLQNFIGNGCVIDARGESSIKYKEQYETMIKDEDIVLVYTGHDTKYNTLEYFNEYPVIQEDLCELFIRKRIKMLGIDTPSPDRYPFKLHKVLLEHDILIIENLTNIKELINEKSFEIIAFPLKIKAEASILRVVAKVI